jgi:hypothetical protein
MLARNMEGTCSTQTEVLEMKTTLLRRNYTRQNLKQVSHFRRKAEQT